MSKSAFSLRIFSIYMFVLGSILVIAPNLLLSFFGVPEAHEVWIRVVGMLVIIIGYLDFMATCIELPVFYRWTVTARLSVPVFFTIFIILGLAPLILLLFGAIDGAGAIYTAICLSSDGLTKYATPTKVEL